MVAKARGVLSPPIDVSDEYTRWLTFANAGMLHRGNLYCFRHAIANLPSKAPVLEIGSFCGLSTNAIGYYLQRAGADNALFTCDRWEFEGADGTVGATGISHGDYRTFVRDSFLRNVRMFSAALPHTVELASDEFFAAWRSAAEVVDVFDRPVVLGGPLSFCYIDGNHSYEYAKRDFEHCHEHLERGGFILFDDSGDASAWEVRQVVSEARASRSYDVAARNPNYLLRRS